jgi:uncharacterized repeat protein (TIGR01451 family)
MRKTIIIGLVLCIAMFIITTVSATEEQDNNFFCIGSGTPHSYKNVPFEIGGVFASVSYPETYYKLQLRDTINLEGYTATAIHIIEHAAYADNVPDGVVVGYIKVYYQDGDETSLALVMGRNIAEWSYDRPEMQDCLQHTKIPPAYSFGTTTDSGYHYLGHYFYISINTQEKPLSHLELTLDPCSYTNQEYYKSSSADWFAIAIKAVTLTLPQPQSTVSITKLVNPFNIYESEATTISIKTENKGSADAKNIKITDSAPTEFTLVSGSMDQNYDTLEPKEYRTYQYTIKATETGRFVTDVASATYEDEKGNSYSCASNPVTITVDGGTPSTPIPIPTPTPTPTPPIEKPHLTISHTTLIEPKIGEETLITVSIENTGNGEAKNIKLRERIPSGLSIDYVEGADSTGNLISWDGDLKPAQTYSIKHSLKVLTAGDKIIPVEVSYEDVAGMVHVTSTTSSTVVIRPISPAPTHTPTVTPTPTEESELSTIPWLYIIILVAVVLGGIAIILAVRRKGEGGAEITIEENTK